MARTGRTTVWLLPVGTNHGGRGPAYEKTESDRRRHRRANDGQHLPLRHLSRHTARRASRSRIEGARSKIMSATPLLTSRRDFLRKSGIAATGLMLSVT